MGLESLVPVLQKPRTTGRRPTGDKLWDQARQEYPILQSADVQYMFQPQGVEPTGMLEFYPPDETQRPQNLPLGRPGVAVFDPKTRPADIAADYVSHYGRTQDPKIKAHYEQFVQSMTPNQQRILRNQYDHARLNEGETRPFDIWAEVSGIPAWYRGYLFQQWPKEFIDQAFSPQQLKQLDAIRPYLTQPQGARE